MAPTTRSQARSRKEIFPFMELSREIRDLIYEYAANFEGVQIYFDKIASLSRKEIEDHFNPRVPDPEDLVANPRTFINIFYLNRQIHKEAKTKLHKTPLIISHPLPELADLQRRQIIDLALPRHRRLKITKLTFQIPDAYPFRQLRVYQDHLPSNWSMMIKFWMHLFFKSMKDQSRLGCICFEFDPNRLEAGVQAAGEDWVPIEGEENEDGDDKESSEGISNEDDASMDEDVSTAEDWLDGNGTPATYKYIRKSDRLFSSKRKADFWDDYLDDDCGPDSDDEESDVETVDDQEPEKAVYVLKRPKTDSLRTDITELGRDHKGAYYLRALHHFLEEHAEKVV